MSIRFSIQKITLGLLLFYAFSFIFRTDNSFDQDLGRHIKLGEIILQTHAVPKTNLFSYTFPDFPFINHHFLFEVLVFLGQQYLGLTALLILKILILLLTIYLTLSLVEKKFLPLLLPLGFLFLHDIRERVELRPEIFSFLLTVITLKILDRFKTDNTKLIYFLPLIQLIWVNSHIYFPVGFIIQTIYLADFLWSQEFTKFKKLAIIFIISILISLLNPNSLNGLLYPLTVFGNYGYQIVENQNMFFLEKIGFTDHNFLFVKFSIIIIFLSFLIGYLRKSLNLKNILLALSGLGLALLHVRSFPYLALLSLPAVIQNFGPLKFNPRWTLLWIITAILLFYESLTYLNVNYYLYTLSDRQVEIAFNQHGSQALDFLLKTKLPGQIFNNFDIGSYIFYRAYPNYPVFVDGRPEAYPQQFFSEEYILAQSNPDKFNELAKKFNFQTIIFSHTDQTPWAKQFLKAITKNPDWWTVYLDDFMIILVKSGQADKLKLRPLVLEKITPEEFNFPNNVSYLRLALFLQTLNYTESSQLFFQRSIMNFPDSPILSPSSSIWW